MRILLFGATGMVGQGVLRECLLHDRVEEVLVIGRSPVPQLSPELEQVVVPDLFDLLGNDHPLVTTYRRKLFAALY